MDGYILFTDGSCLGNPGPGGVGVFLQFPEEFNLKSRSFFRGFHESTNNRMELKAGIEGLKILREEVRRNGYKSITWNTDSKYIADYIYQIPAWRKQKWEKEDGEPISNVDLWKDLEAVRNSLRIYPNWIPREENKEADKLANMGSRNPLYKDFGYNPGKTGTSIGKDGKAPSFYKESNESLHIRVYKGDGEKAKNKCKIRFQIVSNAVISTQKYYAYTSSPIYSKLNRWHEYIISINSGFIESIVKEFEFKAK